MESIYLIIVLVLVGLAVVDLFVGVANDANNFLSSPFGSKVAKKWIVLAVASVGLLAGTLTSNGLMEIARSGVFHPGMFTFNDVMMIFVAVMICDVIMLDMFNTFGMQTSTTVSLIFELLGAAIMVALYKIWTEPGAVSDLSQYINSARAMTLISAILASVVVALICGSIVMFISRMLFTFSFKKTFRRLGAVYAGLCLTAIAYFAVFKGLKYSTDILQEAYQWISANLQTFLLTCFVGFTILMAILQLVFKINILRIIVLSGTFALAMAFAGSDLVNFIGVTMAGIDSYQMASAHAAAGGNIDTLLMSDLAKPVVVQPVYLLLAGGLMILAIWFSKKARTVTDTEINLARQDEGGYERFGSTPSSRAIVSNVRRLSKRITAITPGSVQRFVDKRFEPSKEALENKASFDLIRATVNITVSALLISTATSMKLTLSTSYVTFMVAMGTSLADRAWGRESAVYRVTGVLAMISGWFLTAIIAFSAAAIVSFLLMWGGKIVMAALLLLCVFMLVKTSALHKKRAQKKQQMEAEIDVYKTGIIEKCNADVHYVFKQMSRIYSETLQGLATENPKQLKNLYKEARTLYENEKRKREHEMMPTLIKLQEDAVNTGHYYVQMLSYLYEISKSLLFITRVSSEYIDNNHTGLCEQQASDLEKLNREVSEVYESLANMLRTSDYSDFENVLARRDAIFDLFVENIKAQIKRVKSKESSTRNSMLFIDIVNETKTMLLQSRNMMRAQRLFMGIEEHKESIKS